MELGRVTHFSTFVNFGLGATGSVLAPSSDDLVTSSVLFLVVRPGATSVVLDPWRLGKIRNL